MDIVGKFFDSRSMLDSSQASEEKALVALYGLT